MSIVAGVDFGTLSVRVSIFDSKLGCLGSGVAEYPLRRKREDPDSATQSPSDQMRGFVEACGRAIAVGRCERRPDRSGRRRNHGFDDCAGRRGAGALGRLLYVVRSPGLA